MRKAKNLIGLRAISQDEGKDLGKVHDLLFTSGSRQLLALLISERGAFGITDATAIAWSQVREIGGHAIMVPTEDVVTKVHSDDRIAEAYDNELTLTAKQLTTDKGQTLGKVSDLYINEAGEIVGYEVSGGLFSDAYNGKRYLDAPSDVTVGKNVIIMPHKIVDDLNRQAQQQPGGIKGALNSAGESLGDSYDSAKESVGGAYDSAKQSATDTYENIAGASVEKQREYVIGKTAGTDVIIPADEASAPATSATGAVESGANPNAPAAGALELGDFGNSELNYGAVDIVPVRDNPTAIVPASESNRTDAIVPSNQTAQPAETITELQKATPASATDINSDGEVVDGEVLVRKGETITAQHADRAIDAGILAKLVASAGAGDAQNSDAQNALDGGKEKAQNALGSAQQSAEEAAIGKPAAFEIDAPDGSVIVAPGQTVTREILERADKHGKKAQVISSAGAGAVSQGAQQVYGEAKDVAANAWDAIKEKTQQLVGYTQEKKDEYDEAAQEKKIKDAVGRPVTRVILAPDDTIILNTGDIITNKAINQAREVGYVDMILDSVSDTETKITPEMLRANAEGDATLATQPQPTGGPITATVNDNNS